MKRILNKLLRAIARAACEIVDIGLSGTAFVLFLLMTVPLFGTVYAYHTYRKLREFAYERN